VAAVGNASAHVVYEQLEQHPHPERAQDARDWLGVRIHPEWGALRDEGSAVACA
jgi:hypothetical protein